MRTNLVHMVRVTRPALMLFRKCTESIGITFLIKIGVKGIRFDQIVMHHRKTQLW